MGKKTGSGGGGMSVCESVSCCSACDLDGLGISEFGPQTRNLHSGGSGSGGLESGGWQCRGPKGGLKWAVPLLLSPSLFLSLFPSLCMCSAAPAVGLSTHSLRVIQGRVDGTSSVRQLCRDDHSQHQDTPVRGSPRARRPNEKRNHL